MSETDRLKELIESTHDKHGKRPSPGVWNLCRLCQQECPRPQQTIPDDWPMLARLIARFRTPDDRGLGDTIANNLDKIPVIRGMGLSTAIKTISAKLGASCGCEHRQDRLNERYPYY